nr:hypothetical protein [Tanacetum cinerariifolium]
MIQVLTKQRHFKTAHQLLDKIALRDFLSSPTVLNSLASTCDDPDVNSHVLSWLVIYYANMKMTQDAIQVFEHMRVHGLKLHLPACTVLLSSLVKERLTDTMWKCYKKMLKIGIVPNLHIYNVLIHACCKSLDVVKAEEVMSEMEFKCVSPDLFTYNTLISLYCKKGMHYEALCIQDRMERAGVDPDIITYNSLIYGYCKQGRMREALRMFKEIKGVTPNHVTYTTLIDGFCRVNSYDEAMRLREEMEAKGLFPGTVTYNTILRKLCEEGRIKDANKLLNEMSGNKVVPDNITCNTLINAYCKIGDMDSALKVRRTMLNWGLKPDSFTYKALIHGFCKTRDMENAKEFVFSMINDGFSPNYYTYSWIVDLYCSQKNEEMLVKLPDVFFKKGIIVDIAVYRALIRRLCKQEKVDCAQRLFDIMQSKGISGDSVVFTSLAYAYLKAGDTTTGLKIFDEMYKMRLMITQKIHKSFSDSYAGDKAMRLCEEMEAKGLYPGTVTYNTILIKLLNEMSGKKVVPDNITCNTLINAYCKIGDMNSALKIRAKKNEEVLVKLPDEFYRKGIIIDISIFRALIRRLCKQARVDCAQRLFDIMQRKGISGDSVMFTSLAYAYLKAGDTTTGLKIFNEMYKMRLMITHKIHKSFSASYAGDKGILETFWNLAVERGLLSRNTLKQIAEEYA